jgi:hypothetical protein
MVIDELVTAVTGQVALIPLPKLEVKVASVTACPTTNDGGVEKFRVNAVLVQV